MNFEKKVALSIIDKYKSTNIEFIPVEYDDQVVFVGDDGLVKELFETHTDLPVKIVKKDIFFGKALQQFFGIFRNRKRRFSPNY